MKKMLLLAALIAVVITTIPAYAQEPIQINTEINLTQAMIILGIGLAAAVITSLEGMSKSGTKFDYGKFFIAVKRTAVISVPATFAMLAIYPDPSISAYFMIGITIILGAKMQHSKPETSTTSVITQPSGTVTATIETNSNSIPKSVEISNVVIPKLGPEDENYQTNFIQNKDGNALPFGANLWIRLVNVRSYVTAILRNEAGQIIQIDQSSQFDEDGDISTTRLEMLGRDGHPLPRGKYKLQVRGDFGPSDSQSIKNDEFLII